MTRPAAREVAVRLCFSADLAGDSVDAVIGDFFEPEHYATMGTEDTLFTEAPSENDMEYIRHLVGLVAEHRAELDETVARYARGWTLSRISRISLAILRCAICEILYLDDVPTGTAINEAVEIAKRYEEPETARFINGILGSYVREELEAK
ncbi:MAG: transcription antitermination factor NusB [Oscillospiraceae bacterium]|nr:transcription antitermination factor NusB [Oscillospiraceae bacterium]MDD6503306.1 transcription antitermination factor NusB [Oscillospiraceae bacterium]MDY4105942.1 transcription antitermination factor NusB [Oscillospiraceae bacterium]